MAFRNQQAFDDPKSRLAATGVDLRRSNAITDPQGRILAHAQTGGMLSPVRHEIAAGAKLFRFGSRTAGVARVAAGAWWLEQSAFDQLFRFAQVWELSIGMAMRLLCLVPPEWSDATLLIRARAVEPLLAWRGLAMSVVTPAKAGGAPVRMPHQNDIAARRVYQLFIPRTAYDPHVQPLTVEQDYPLDSAAAQRGFLYL
ncbi:MAG TPA: hypothetical protein VEX11_10675 [Acetobacteraceae bacterium]|nr:hypothetical protein [Acetobacteraceae bacterium]